jgi:uncharacterized phiE125 gp8 family phage protein
MHFRSVTVQTPPTVEPVSLAEAKAHCRVDTIDDDAYIASLITAARQWCEAYMDETLLHQQLVMRMDGFPPEIRLPRPPMATAGTTTVTSITYTLNETLATATLSTSEYRVDRESKPGVIRHTYGGAWPPYLEDYNAVRVTWWAGRGADGSAVPPGIRNAILMLVSHFYEHRMAADATSLSEVPFGVKALLDAARWGSYT